MWRNGHVPTHTGAAVVMLAAALAVLFAFPLAMQAWSPGLAGFAWGWFSFLLGIPLLSLAVVLGLAEAPPATFSWMIAFALPVFMVAALLHLAVANATGRDEPVFLLIAQLAPPVLLLAGCLRLLYSGVVRTRPRLQHWWRHQRVHASNLRR